MVECWAESLAAVMAAQKVVYLVVAMGLMMAVYLVDRSVAWMVDMTVESKAGKMAGYLVVYLEVIRADSSVGGMVGCSVAWTADSMDEHLAESLVVEKALSLVA